jgi:tetratricopeptide (TPR) repeat protein
MRLAFLASILAPAALFAGDEDAAVVMVERAVAAYEAGDYEKAGAFFLEAFELSRLPNQLRNAAKAFQRAERLDRASSLWERYLGLEGIGASDRNEAKAQIALIAEKKRTAAAREEAERARLEAVRIDARTSTEAASPPRPAPPVIITERPAPLPIGPILTFSGAGAAAIASLWLFFHSSTKLSNLDERLENTDSDGLIVGISPPDAEEELDDVNDERTAAAVLAGISGAAVVAGTLWLILTPSGASAAVSLSSEGAFASVTGRF